MRRDQLLLLAGVCLLAGIALPSNAVLLGVLWSLVALSATGLVIRLVRRRARRERAPLPGAMIHVRRRRPQAVRKERRA